MSPQDFENQVKANLNNLSTVPPEKIRLAARLVLQMLGDEAPKFDDEEVFIEQIARSLEQKLDLCMPDATVVKLPFAEWLADRRASTAMFFWDRYRRHLLQDGFPKEVVGTIGRDTDKIVGLLENPQKEGPWKRRGLVVGHVQSGKTANYSGVIGKAADYGYKVIILLAGVHNNLRSQTQQRIEEAFIGVDTDKLERNLPYAEAVTGVGKISDISRVPFSLTSREHDFRRSSRRAATFNLRAVNEPVIFVIKKQTSVLKNLVEFLRGLNATKNGKICGISMLLIDDEADNASVNTASEESDPTRINGLIRQLLSLFEQNSYVGYTATPFANIFIDPDSEHEMLEDDLFPRHFIVTLDAPENYVSAARIFGDDGDLQSFLMPVSDHQESFPEQHKIDHPVSALPDSLMQAVRRFILGRAVRILRGRGQDHSSMLVNVSRFNGVQRLVTGLLAHYLEELLNAVKLHSALPDNEALRDPSMRLLHQTWIGMAITGGESWEQVKTKLPQAAGAIVVKTINNKSADKLDYKNHKENGLHVVAVGGLSLSRGFTLEGLMVSYFVRNSIMYDTLLQMGRWFGYRDGYLDLFSLYMTNEAIGWYSHISSAIDELREEFRLMDRQGRRPEDFGLKVRASPDSLIVTARNKMRSGRSVVHSVTLDGRMIETVYLKDSPTIIAENFGILVELVEELAPYPYCPKEDSENGLGHLWSGVSHESICRFISNFKNHDEASAITQTGPAVRFIKANLDRLSAWDVCIYSVNTEAGRETPVAASLKVGKQIRGCQKLKGCFQIGGSKMRVASRGAERAGLTAEQSRLAKQNYQGQSNVPDREYRALRTRPLLMLHVLDLTDNSTSSDEIIAKDVCAWGISFPGAKGNKKGVEVEYVVNTTWWKEEYSDDIDDGEEAVNESA